MQIFRTLWDIWVYVPIPPPFLVRGIAELAKFDELPMYLFRRSNHLVVLLVAAGVSTRWMEPLRLLWPLRLRRLLQELRCPLIGRWTRRLCRRLESLPGRMILNYPLWSFGLTAGVFRICRCLSSARKQSLDCFWHPQSTAVPFGVWEPNAKVICGWYSFHGINPRSSHNYVVDGRVIDYREIWRFSWLLLPWPEVWQ